MLPSINVNLKSLHSAERIRRFTASLQEDYINVCGCRVSLKLNVNRKEMDRTLIISFACCPEV